MYGTYGNDYLTGTSGNDIIDGLGDTYYYGSQQDTLVGGAGADTFVLGGGSIVYYLDDLNYPRDSFAVIQDYRSWEGDVIELGGIQSGYNFQDIGGGVEIFYYGDLISFMPNVNSSQLVIEYI